jgi:hypothetical protein
MTRKIWYYDSPLKNIHVSCHLQEPVVDLKVEQNNSKVQTSCLGSIVHIACTLWMGEDTNKNILKRDHFLFWLINYAKTQWVLNLQPHIPPCSFYKKRRYHLSWSSLAWNRTNCFKMLARSSSNLFFQLNDIIEKKKEIKKENMWRNRGSNPACGEF